MNDVGVFFVSFSLFRYTDSPPSPLPIPSPILKSDDDKVKRDVSMQIRVKDQTGEEVFFKVKPHTQMGKIFDSYAKRKGVETRVLRFMLDGKRIQAHETPDELELEDLDQIDCLLEQIGGGGMCSY